MVASVQDGPNNFHPMVFLEYLHTASRNIKGQNQFGKQFDRFLKC